MMPPATDRWRQKTCIRRTSKDDEWAHGPTDGEIFTNIRNGIGPKFDMKPWKSKMTAQEIWNVVNYLRSLEGAAAR